MELKVRFIKKQEKYMLCIVTTNSEWNSDILVLSFFTKTECMS